MSLPAARDLMRCLPEKEQNRLEDQTPTWEIVDVMDAAEGYIQELEIEVATLQDGQKRAATQLEIDYARAVRVLTAVTKHVQMVATTTMTCQTDDFAKGMRKGRTGYAKDVLEILKDGSK